MINVLHLGLSYNCNMKCSHCFVKKRTDYITFDDIKKTIDELEKEGLFYVFYTFGEPLLDKKFSMVSEYVNQKGMMQILMTNGTIISKEIIQILKNNNVKNIYVSLDSSNSEKHNKNRNFNGAYEKAINCIKKLKEEKFNVGIAVTVTNENVCELEEIYKLALNHGVKNISFLKQRENGHIIKLDNEKKYINFYINRIIKINPEINLLFHDYSLIDITKKLYKDGQISKDFYEKYFDMNSCHEKTTISLAPNGDVLTCNLISPILGNIKEDSINTILVKRRDCSECFNCFTKLSE